MAVSILAVQKSELDKLVRELFVKLMKNCKVQRRLNGGLSVRALAAELSKTENYISAVENGRVFPSMRVFLKYLIMSGFDTEPLLSLRANKKPVKRETKSASRTRLLEKVYSLEPNQIDYMLAQADLAKALELRSKGTRKKRKP